MDFFGVIARPLGSLMQFIYNNLSFWNYGLAIVLFTILTKVLLMPLTIKQYRSTARMQALNPKLEDLRRQYGTDKNRLNEETMKLYQEEKINPMGSCLPLLIQMPILLALYRVITMPLTYMVGKTAEQLEQIRTIYFELSGATQRAAQGIDMEMMNFFKLHPEFMDRVSGLLDQADLLNMNFLGLDLSKIPTFQPAVLFGPEMSTYLPLLLIPVVGVVSTFISTKLSSAPMASSNQNQQAASMNKTMMMMGPIMTLIFSFQLPAGVLLYWIAGYVIQIIMQLFVNKYIFKLGQPQETPETGKARSRDDATGNKEVSGHNAASGSADAGAKADKDSASSKSASATKASAGKGASSKKAPEASKKVVEKKMTAADPGAVWNPHIQEFEIPAGVGDADCGEDSKSSGDSKKG